MRIFALAHPDQARALPAHFSDWALMFDRVERGVADEKRSRPTPRDVGWLMATFEVRFDGIDEMVAAMRAQVARAPDAAEKVAHGLAAAFIRDAKKNATGPPRIPGKQRRTRARKGKPSRVMGWREGGPGVLTGFLRNSIQVRQDHATGRGWETTVHPSGPYYRRLELGFKGRDSIGRQYNQPAYPFMRPALTTTRGRALPIARKGFKEIFGS